MQLRLDLNSDVISINDYKPVMARGLKSRFSSKRARRYYLHAKIKQCGVAVSSRQRQINITMDQYDVLPDSIKRCVLELVGAFGYNVQTEIPE